MHATLEEFEIWLRERGYDKMMGEENFRVFLNLGFASLLFQGSNLLISFVLQKLGFPSERISEKVRFVVGRRIKVVKATKNELEIELD